MWASLYWSTNYWSTNYWFSDGGGSNTPSIVLAVRAIYDNPAVQASDGPLAVMANFDQLAVQGMYAQPTVIAIEDNPAVQAGNG